MRHARRQLVFACTSSTRIPPDPARNEGQAPRQASEGAFPDQPRELGAAELASRFAHPAYQAYILNELMTGSGLAS
jgi:hypothetical protein